MSTHPFIVEFFLRHTVTRVREHQRKTPHVGIILGLVPRAIEKHGQPLAGFRRRTSSYWVHKCVLPFLFIQAPCRAAFREKLNRFILGVFNYFLVFSRGSATDPVRKSKKRLLDGLRCL